jgi:S1-C subfamily serine protease
VYSFRSREETKMKKTILVLTLIVMPVLGYAGFRSPQIQMEQGPIAGQDPIAAQEESRAPRAQIPPQDRKAKLGVEGLMGFVVRGVESGSTAEEAGIRPGDVITHLNGQQVYTIQDVQKLWAHSPGEQVSVRLLRIGPDGQLIKTQQVSGRLKSY